MSQRARVVELYKKLLRLGKEYPGGYVEFRTTCHEMFKKNVGLTDNHKIEVQIGRAEFMVKEVEKLNNAVKEFYATEKRP